MSEKKIVFEIKEVAWASDLENMDLTRALCYIQDLKSGFSSDAVLRVEHDYEDTHYYINVPRLETEVEYEIRLKKEAKKEANKLASIERACLARQMKKIRTVEDEKKLYLALKEKYEPAIHS